MLTSRVLSRYFLRARKLLFSVLKASLLLSIESIRTVGGLDSVTALERVLADLEGDAKVWQVVHHVDIIPKAEADFGRLAKQLLKLREEETYNMVALEK